MLKDERTETQLLPEVTHQQDKLDGPDMEAWPLALHFMAWIFNKQIIEEPRLHPGKVT